MSSLEEKEALDENVKELHIREIPASSSTSYYSASSFQGGDDDGDVVKPVPESGLGRIPGRFWYAGSHDGVDENLLILLHGLGGTHIPFSKLGKQFKLPQTAVLALCAPEQVPFLEEEAYQWYPSFDPLTGELISNPNPTPALEYLKAIITYLTQKCEWPLDRIHFFGFAQGGSVAVEFGLHWWKEKQLLPAITTGTSRKGSTTGLLSPSSSSSQAPSADTNNNNISTTTTITQDPEKKKRDQKQSKREDDDPQPPTSSFGSIITIGGPLLSFPSSTSLSSPSPTPLLALSRRPSSSSSSASSGELTFRSSDVSGFRKGYRMVREVMYDGGSGGGMPAGKGDWEPIMRFWSERLWKRKRTAGGAGKLYEVLSGYS